jgi:SAM-dependent methyltransferase
VTTPQLTQAEFWNSPMAARWIEAREYLDHGLAGITAALFERAAPRPGEHALDVGCGTGTTTLLLSERVGPTGSVVGCDISAPLLGEARARAAAAGAPITFIEGDAGSRRFERPFDLILSRFGVMFFEDPVAAFGNLRAALAPGGRVAFVCWRTPRENAWASGPIAAAGELLPPQPPPDPTAPGPFAFADRGRVAGILAAAGFADVAIAAHDDVMLMGATPEEAAGHALFIGPLSRAVADQPEEVREQIRRRLVTAMAAFMGPRGAAPPAAVWLVTAR